MNNLNKTVMDATIGFIIGAVLVVIATYSILSFIQWDLAWYTNIVNWDEADRLFFAMLTFPLLIATTILGAAWRWGEK